jgi:phosphatidate cytidylyltransferase
MAQPSARPDLSNLTLRVMSAAALLPTVALLIWMGGWPFIAFAALAGGAMGWEFAALCRANSLTRALMMGILIAAPFLVVAGETAASFFIFGGAILVALDALRSRHPEAALMTTGIIYLFVGTLALAWLRVVPANGMLVVFWVVAVVVGTDVGAYFAGRAIGGPKLAPRISPSKTWAGLFGGMACAAAGGWAVAMIGPGSASFGIVVLGAGIAVVAQIGDLIESAVKRRAGVKDSGNLIPGHGGVLDRLDGYLLAAPVVALVTVAAGGNPLEW